MKKTSTFCDILEAADRLSLEEQRAIIDILNRRMIEQRRREIVKEIYEARKEFQNGLCRELSSEEIMKEILS
jgi:hypothetical protein